MYLHTEHYLERLCLAGISYRQADEALRGRFALTESQAVQLLHEAAALGIRSLVVLSTCNRTELYGYAPDPAILTRLLSNCSGGSWDDLVENGYACQGRRALRHLYRVAAGLDSQIIGDCEVLGQLKRSVARSRSQGMLGPVMDRTLNFVFRAAKQIRTQTGLCGGTTSVSYGAVEWLRQNLPDAPLRALLIGAGDFGAAVGRNLAHYLPALSLTITNRTDARSQALAAEIGADVLPFEQLDCSLQHFDVIVTAASAPAPLVCSSHFVDGQRRWILDLSVPATVHPDVAALPGISFAALDEISAVLQANLSKRMAEIPEAMRIIDEYEKSFVEWLCQRRYAKAVSLFQQHLSEFAGKSNPYDLDLSPDTYSRLVRESVHRLTMQLHSEQGNGCSLLDGYRLFMNHVEWLQAAPAYA